MWLIKEEKILSPTLRGNILLYISFNDAETKIKFPSSIICLFLFQKCTLVDQTIKVEAATEVGRGEYDVGGDGK